jgi:hypothetical protein
MLKGDMTLESARRTDVFTSRDVHVGDLSQPYARPPWTTSLTAANAIAATPPSEAGRPSAV